VDFAFAFSFSFCTGPGFGGFDDDQTDIRGLVTA
jgi:hypothetical protein